MLNEHTVYIAMGSNLGDRAATLTRAEQSIAEAGVRITRRSRLYTTEPVDAPPQPWFLNSVLEAETNLMPAQLLHALAGIERAMGRRRDVPRGPRTLDLDILFYDSNVIHTAELEIPHPGIPFRRFVLVPLAEIAPALRHPVLHKSISELLVETPDKGQIRPWTPPSE
jgi:2-amino-4-hydroxy-6-hydroxymethyldihydropteridine diphosphokinase